MIKKRETIRVQRITAKSKLINKTEEVLKMLGCTDWGVALRKKKLVNMTVKDNEKYLMKKLDDLDWRSLKKLCKKLEVENFRLTREVILKNIVDK